MITEKVMPIAMFLLLIMIGINAFIVTIGTLEDNSGNPLSDQIGSGSNQLGSDLKQTGQNVTVNTSATSSPTSGTDTGFNIFNYIPFWNEVSGAVSTAIGIDNVKMFDNALFGLEKLMDKFIEWFSFLSPIFLAIKYFAYAVKILVVGYAGTVLARAVVGRLT